jgi:hypothetical protein
MTALGSTDSEGEWPLQHGGEYRQLREKHRARPRLERRRKKSNASTITNAELRKKSP